MPEGKQEKKKTWIVKRILKWIGLGLLSLLLIAAIIFQAPWKVITLLAVILLACTALPKPLRKFFWASVGVVVIALIIWVFLPEDNGDWRPYTFDDELAALEAKYAIPDSENAAVIYYGLMDSFDVNSFNHFYYDENAGQITKDFWLSEEHSKIATWIDEQRELINLLAQAGQYEKCRIPIVSNYYQYGQKHPRNFNELNLLFFESNYSIYKMGPFLVTVANNDIGEGRIHNGLQKYMNALQVGKHLRQQHNARDILSGAAIERIVYRQLNQFLINKGSTAEQGNFIADCLKSTDYNWETEFERILEYDKFIYKVMLCGMTYQTNSRGEIRLNRDPNSTLRKLLPAYPDYSSILARIITHKASDTFEKQFTKAEALVCWFFMPSNPEEAGQIIEEVIEEFWTMEEAELESLYKIYFKPTLNYRLFSEKLLCYFLWNCNSIYKLYQEAATEYKGCQIITALSLYKNRYGHWPKKLDDVKEFAEPEVFLDSFNNTPFIYKLAEDNFKLYSVGMNNIDEDGEYEAEHGINLRGGPPSLDYEEDDILIWPPRNKSSLQN